ncbi:trypsin-like peptidase domain-containing protein [Paracidovorax anthurii]|uniref:Trypsin-like peptidase n=1 Tax=Paracidovorax anthurii TaxID=78229 RepID=A0A328ZEM9_9BURK|nr:trypsin-like peptidase domain-containing protein [Paracidovorax anthurii]RAR80686.1 trypsin-like peptidase [Paracidovorax anthurii]
MNVTLKKWPAAAWLAAAALLAACGGGDGAATTQAGATASAETRAAVTRVESAEQPATAVQDVPRIRERAADAAVAAARVGLGAFVRSESALVERNGARQIGAPRSVGDTATAAGLRQRLQWTATESGGAKAAVSFTSEGAHGVRLGVLVRSLPGSAVLRIYRQDRPTSVYEIAGQEILQTLQRNRAAGDLSDKARTWWSPDSGAGEITLEIELPAGTPVDSLDIAIPTLSHIFEDLSLPSEDSVSQEAVNDASTCNLDSTCYDDYASQRNAVARMTFVDSGLTYNCTGTLLNDRDSTGTPYFLTANHCISSQTVASSLQTDWFFRSPTCNSRTLSSSAARRTGGATLLYASSNTDTSFLRLNEAPPAGAVFAAWDANAQSLSSAVAGIHHPKGDLQKISFGSIVSTLSCARDSATSFTCSTASGLSGSFYRVTYTQGTTQAGSSGSAIFRGGAVVGTLYGSNSNDQCTTTAFSVYGRFDLAYSAALQQWLSPAVATPSGRSAVYRFYNRSTGAHFFTQSAGERDFVIQTYPAFSYEGVAFYAYAGPTTGQSAVYRFFNTGTGAHFYTISQGERDFVQATYPAFRYEGPSWYAQTAAGSGSTAIYRFFNRSNGTHFYTISQAERDFVIATYPVYQYEGPVYYAWTAAN